MIAPGAITLLGTEIDSKTGKCTARWSFDRSKVAVMDIKELAEKAIDSGGAPDRSTVALTIEQRDMVDRAIEKLRSEVDSPALSEGRCLEIICFDFLQSFLVDAKSREEILGEKE